jgi:hypothetical protein
MVWARRIDESPNPGENEKPGARLDRIPPSGYKKNGCQRPSRGRLEMLLHRLERASLRRHLVIHDVLAFFAVLTPHIV